VRERGRISPGPPDCGLDAGAYLLGALEPDEARAFRRHLDGCAVCRDEVIALAPVLEVLPGAAPPRAVRRALRRRVLRAVRDEPKARPLADERARSRRPVRLSAPTGWLALGLAVAAAVIVQLGASHTGARVIRASVGRAELRVAGGRGDLVVAHLAPLPANRVYELWLQSGRRTIPSTLFAVTSRGRANIGVPGDLRGVSRLMVTVEPRGGSLVPTTRAVIQVPVNLVRRS
jgi:anti-sigma-K factor RskA